MNAYMRISWWLSRLRRWGPLASLLLLGYLILRYHPGGTKPSHQHAAPATVRPPPTPPSNPLLKSWVIVGAAGGRDPCFHVASEFAGWMVLIHGVGQASNISHSRCVYLTPSGQEQLRKKLLLPAGLDSSLPVALLYAIEHGAEAIYLPPRNISATSLYKPTHLFPTHRHQGLLYQPPSNTQSFDSKAHFGCARSPDERESLDHTFNYSLCTHSTPAIQAPARWMGKLPHPKTLCDQRSPPVTIAQDIFVPFEFFGTLYLKEAFWALPVVTSTAKEEYLWSTVVQFLLWMQGQQLLVHSQSRHTQEHVDGISKNIIQNVRQLHTAWKCEQSEWFSCMLQFVKTQVKAQAKSESQTGNVPLLTKLDTWLATLKKLELENNLFNKPAVKLQCSKERVNFLPVDYSAKVYQRKQRNKSNVPANNISPIKQLHNTTCNRFKVPRDSKIYFTQPWTQFDDILLVVTFNNPHYEIIPYIETLYRPFFPYILYCGPGWNGLHKIMNEEKYSSLFADFNFTFVSYGENPKGHTAGSFNYKCMALAMSIHYNVEGYLAMADDMILSTYKMNDFSRHMIWFLPREEVRTGEVRKLRECRLGMCDFYPHWHWWEDYKAQTLTLLQRFKDEHYRSHLLYRCHQQLVNLNGAEYRANGGYSDIYYIPQRLASDFASLAAIFLEEQVFLEIAVPTIIQCLEMPDNIISLPGLAVWDETRENVYTHFNPSEMLGKVYLHPAKWSYLARGQDDFVFFYCTNIIPFLHDQYGRIR